MVYRAVSVNVFSKDDRSEVQRGRVCAGSEELEPRGPQAPGLRAVRKTDQADKSGVVVTFRRNRRRPLRSCPSW